MGIVSVALCASCFLWCKEDYDDGPCVKGIRGCANGCTCCTTVLYLTWAIIGFSIYFQEMTDDCIDDEMGGMVYGWSVVYLLMFSIMLVVWCIGFFVVKHFMGSQSDSDHVRLAAVDSSAA